MTPADEGLHTPTDEYWWNESWYFDFAREDGSFGGYVRIGLNPNQGTTWFLLNLVGTDLPTVRIDDKLAPLSGLTLETETYRFGHVGTDGTWRISGSGTAESAPPEEFLAGRSGIPVDVALDLTWTMDGEPFHYDVTTRYEVPCLVSGTVAVDGQEWRLEAVEGQRDHSYGVRDWKQASWCWSSARLADGRRVHVTDVVFPEFRYTTGYVDAETVTDVVRVDHFDGLNVRTNLALAPSGLDVTVTTLAHGPTLITDEDGITWPFLRSLARFDTEAGSGVGWIEWNRTDLR